MTHNLSPLRLSRHIPWTSAVFVVILAITVALHFSERSRIEEARANLLELDARIVVDGVEAALGDYTSGARAAAALIQHDPDMSQAEYGRAMDQVVRTERSQAITATNVIKQIRATELDRAIATKQAVDGRPFEVYPSRQTDTLAPIWLLYPFEGNESARGFDILANESAVQTLQSSLESGEPRMTPGLTIVQETEDQVGFIIYVPTQSPSFAGWTNAVFRGQQFLQNVLGDQDTLNVEVRDGSGPEAKVIGRIPLTTTDPATTPVVITRTLFGQEWLFSFSPTPALTAQVPDDRLIAMTFGGVALAFIGAAFVYLLIRQREAAEALVRDRTAELVMTNQQLIEAGKVKDDFLAVVSHELRTPITVIRGMGEMAREESDHPSTLLYLDRIEHNARRMGDLVEDLLLTAQIDAGKVTPSITEVPLLPALEEVVADLNEALTSGIELTVEDRDATALVDPAHLERIIANLVTNADKYGAAPIRIDVRHDGDKVVITVADDGPGVPEHLVPTLFERFEQGNSGRRRTVTGVGLGLSVVRDLAELSGGTAEYRSGHGKHAFEVRLPTTAVTAPSRSPSKTRV